MKKTKKIPALSAPPAASPAFRIPFFAISGHDIPGEVAAFLKNVPVETEAEQIARSALEQIRAGGDRAVATLMKKFNRVTLSPRRFPISAKEMDAAAGRMSPAFRKAVAMTVRHVERFSRAGLRKDWSLSTSGGGRVGERFLPLQRMGAYIPGGVSPLASTALMTLPLARVAGVRERVACTPCRPDGSVDPHILYALREGGATEAYRLGGIQAIGAMAYGTETIRRVDKIVGPGGPYVTAAKRLVYGDVALDMVAGPSEVAVLCDESAGAAQVAADILSQAEHGTGHERTLCVTSSQSQAFEIRDELWKQGTRLPRWNRIRQVLEQRSMLIHTADLRVGMEIVNAFAPEHFELWVEKAARWLPQVRCAGAVFVGPWTPESAGDFVAGPSHVLPTGGSARFASGLTVEDFRRRMSVVELARADLKRQITAIETFAGIERLPAHGISARKRLEARPRGRTPR